MCDRILFMWTSETTAPNLVEGSMGSPATMRDALATRASLNWVYKDRWTKIRDPHRQIWP